MSHLSFEEAVARLGEYQSRGWRLGLDRMQEFLHRLGLDDKLGHPDNSGRVTRDSPQFIHVAGTNGKGSVCAYLQSMLHEQGFRVGATYSPYVYDVRERVQLGRELIRKHDFARLTETLLAVGETLEDTEFGGPTEFEMKTALGFLYWAEKQAEWVALEVGLGGRLDATNVVDPACSVIVSIGLDHTAILGDTIELIAREKAGIIKPGRPVVIGDLPKAAREVVKGIAKENNAPLFAYGEDFIWSEGTVSMKASEHRFLEPGIKGVNQGHNLAVAIMALEVTGTVKDSAMIARGSLLAHLPGRFELREYRGRRILLDGAHNAEAATNLVETIHQEWMGTNFALVTGRLEGHDHKRFFDALAPVVGKTYVAPINFHRTMQPGQVIKESQLENARAYGSSREAFDAAVEETKPGDTILVTGSFYLVGEIGSLIKA